MMHFFLRSPVLEPRLSLIEEPLSWDGAGLARGATGAGWRGAGAGAGAGRLGAGSGSGSTGWKSSEGSLGHQAPVSSPKSKNMSSFGSTCNTDSVAQRLMVISKRTVRRKPADWKACDCTDHCSRACVKLKTASRESPLSYARRRHCHTIGTLKHATGGAGTYVDTHGVQVQVARERLEQCVGSHVADRVVLNESTNATREYLVRHCNKMFGRSSGGHAPGRTSRYSSLRAVLLLRAIASDLAPSGWMSFHCHGANERTNEPAGWRGILLAGARYLEVQDLDRRVLGEAFGQQCHASIVELVALCAVRVYRRRISRCTVSLSLSLSQVKNNLPQSIAFVRSTWP